MNNQNHSKPLLMLSDEKAWNAAVAANNDAYGSAVVRYAEYWAVLMEAEIAKGNPVNVCAEACRLKADTDGITGFMYGCAVALLSKTWIHGEELRRWHNKDIQIGTEGDRANENGGVLNPAMLNVGL